MAVALSSEETAEAKTALCEGIAEGKSVASICRQDDMPSRDTVYKWLREDAEFADNYVRAREEQADFYADEIIEIADTEKDANRARVRIDARKWKAARMKPKSYGDKVQHTGADGDSPVTVNIVRFADGDDPAS